MSAATVPDPIHFLAGGYTTEQLLTFRPSEEYERRFEELIAREKNGGLHDDEADELNGMMETYHVMTLAQSQARLAQIQKSAA